MTGKKPERSPEERASTTFRIVVVLVMVMFIAIVALFLMITDLKSAVLANRETGFRNRAVGCQQIFNTGTPVNQLPAVCQEKEVLVYMKVDVPAPTSATKEQGERNFRMLCQILRNQGTAPDQCNGV